MLLQIKNDCRFGTIITYQEINSPFCHCKGILQDAKVLCWLEKVVMVNIWGNFFIGLIIPLLPVLRLLFLKTLIRKLVRHHLSFFIVQVLYLNSWVFLFLNWLRYYRSLPPVMFSANKGSVIQLSLNNSSTNKTILIIA